MGQLGQYREPFIVHGVYTITNSLGIEVQISDSGDMIRYRHSDKLPSKWQHIKWDKNGEPYFHFYRNKIYLSQVTKV